MSPRISVIVPVYNAEKFIHRCVNSVLSQPVNDWELILVDDGSPDNSGALCDEYALQDVRIKVVHKANGGVSTARNAGLDEATGKWITFVDADDYIEGGFLDIPDDADEDLLILNYKTIGSCEKFTEFSPKTVSDSQRQEYLKENVHKQILCVPWAKFFKSSIIKDNGIRFTEGVKIGEDTLFVLDYLYHAGTVRQLGIGNYVYLSSGDDFGKYKLTAEKAVEIFHYFVEKFNRLKVESDHYLDMIFCYYWGLSYPMQELKKKRVWYKDKVVKDIYKKVVRRQKNLKWRIKYNLLRILS